MPWTPWVEIEKEDSSNEGIKELYNVTKNPIPWMKTWLASDTVQVAPQEVEISSYLVGQVDSEVNVEDLGDFEL